MRRFGRRAGKGAILLGCWVVVLAVDWRAPSLLRYFMVSAIFSLVDIRPILITCFFIPSVALDVGGNLPAQIWGRQWIKLLALLYDGVMSGKVGGDTTAEGKAARVRVQLDIERIMSANPGTGTGTNTGMGMN
jgi:hypothetical protein